VHIVKDHDVRYSEFLDAAQALFMQKGYEETTVAAIIAAVGVSKGAFYHYFDGKEDLLDAIADRAAAAGVRVMQPIADDPVMPALDKLNAIYAASTGFKVKNRDTVMTLMRVLYDDRNLRLRKRIEGSNVGVAAPLLAKILDQGSREGSMCVIDPTETAGLILQLGSALVERIADAAITATGGDGTALERVLASMRSYREAICRIVGAAPGSIKIIEDDIVAILLGKDQR
jgi:AcrR family transcriptional regulator